MYRNIFTNQCGYLENMPKHVTIRSDKPVGFTVLRSDGKGVFHSEANIRVVNESAGEINYIGDFSSISQPGRYYISADGLGESDTFIIGNDVYEDVFRKSVAFFYLQRCGQDLPKNAAGLYAHSACHTGIASVYQSEQKREVSGGWHDAGDYGRYVGPGAMAVAQLLYAYERNRTLADGYTCPNPQENLSTLPAFLEELKYELDWMMKMQREDGALYHKASCHKFCSFIMPEDEKEEMILSPVSVTATADFAAVCAMAIRFYKTFDADYAKKLETCAKKAYEALKTLSLPGGFVNPPEITTGEYGDTEDKDERYWAAAELYKAFGDECYRKDFESLAAEKIYQGYGWVEMGSYGNLAYLTTDYPTDETLKDKIKAEMIRLADKLIKVSEADGYGTALTAKQYDWGSNLSVANHGLHLYDAWRLTGDSRYLDAACEQLHYLLGRNPMGLCYVSGCGTNAIKHPHHRPSGYVGKAMPGMLSGGPCNWLADETIRSLFTKETAPAPAKCLVDMTGSYSTNEVTIYWNSAFVQLLASVTE